MNLQHHCNLKPRDTKIRYIIATILLFCGLLLDSYASIFVSLFLFYTAIKKFCPMYYIMKINERYGFDNYYLSLLPKHRKTPVFIFDENGKIVFQNNSSHKLKLEIKNLEDLEVKNSKEFITQNIEENKILKFDNIYYQIDLIALKDEKLILSYFDDVTQVMELNDEIEQTQKEVIYAMGEIGETRSKETGNHVKRVAKYSKELALLYGLSQKEADILQMASPMHDIGKVGIPDNILNKPAKLTLDEWKIMQTHAQLGYEMLKNSNKPILKAASIVAHEHHEKWDGSGYPRGLSGEDIHIYGRITAVADVFDALGSERVYKKAWALEDILELFKKESEKHFDPKLVELFLNNLDRFLAIRDKYKDVVDDE
jgi:response regulator RpfG family c-di-GMP phosphodiesterase